MTERDLDRQSRTRDSVAAALQGMQAPTRAHLARLLDITPQTLSAYENRRQTPKLDQAVVIAETLGLTLDELAGREPLPNRPPEYRDLAWQIRSAAETLASLSSALPGIALDVERLGAEESGDSETG